MSTVSEQFRQAREAQHLTIEQVADLTKMRSDHVRAFEAGNFSVFSAPVYLRGFARTYARLLKLDVPQLNAALEQELSGTTQPSEPQPLSLESRGALDFVMLQLSRLNKNNVQLGIGAAVCLVVFGILVLVWRHQSTSDPLAGIKPGIYHPTTGNVGDTLNLPSPRH